MQFQSTSEKHLLFNDTDLFSCSVLEVIITFVLLIFSDDIIARLEVYVSIQ